jgi:RNA recognition motif-containing protein
LLHADKVARVSLVLKNGEQKDYCYVEYQTKEAAEDEVKNNVSGYKLNISKPPSGYDENSTLFVCALPQSATEDKIKALFGEHVASITEVRLKLDKAKNYAYVEFTSAQEKEKAFEFIKGHSMVVDGKNILVQHCDSSRAKHKKFIPVVFVKNLAFKAREADIRQFF